MGWFSEKNEELKEAPYDAEKEVFRSEVSKLNKRIKELERENKELKTKLASRK